MKFVRTEEGHIYERLFIDQCLNRGVSVIVNGEIMPYKEKIIKESDLVKDLCDCFIYDWGDGVYGVEYDFEFTSFAKKIYGAIWITLPNGAPELKPVAEMRGVGYVCLL